MIVERESFLTRTGVPQFDPGCFLKFDSDIGQSAWVSWSRDGDVRLGLYFGPKGEEDDAVIEIWGTYDDESECFDVQARDDRPDAGSPDDIDSALANFRRHLAVLKLSNAGTQP